ncbi:MAG: thioredoxin family protein [Rhodospirillales bacterium]|nr:thioredoxin family protein [Rhodospirillales bacterium]
MRALASRRSVLTGAVAGLLAGGISAAQVQAGPGKAVLGEDGLYHMPWYLESFLDVEEDLTAASAQGKRFVVLWGLRGCSLCRRMHEEHLAQAAIADYVRANFDVLHLNILGARSVTDFDGAKLSEKAFAERYGIRGTPSLQFFPTSADGLAQKAPAAREVARLAGLPAPPEFLAMFRYVRDKAYETSTFEDFRKRSGAGSAGKTGAAG